MTAIICERCGRITDDDYDRAPYGVELHERGDGTLGHLREDPTACGDPDHCSDAFVCGPAREVTT